MALLVFTSPCLGQNPKIVEFPNIYLNTNTINQRTITYKNEKSGEIDINKSIYKNDLNPVVSNCQCYTCLNFTRSYLHHLFKQREILGYTLATFHNLWVMEKLFEGIRDLIIKDKI